MHATDTMSIVTEVTRHFDGQWDLKTFDGRFGVRQLRRYDVWQPYAMPMLRIPATLVLGASSM